MGNKYLYKIGSAYFDEYLKKRVVPAFKLFSQGVVFKGLAIEGGDFEVHEEYDLCVIEDLEDFLSEVVKIKKEGGL